MPDVRLALVAAMVAATPLPAVAAPQCTLPNEIPMPRAERPSAAEPVRREAIGGYTLALSWSPEYCATRARGAAFQCGSANRFGFVLHGLWPDGRGRSWPQYCRPAAILPRKVIAENLCMTPSAQLLQHEWAKHGTCMAARPENYFAKARTLYAGLRLPGTEDLRRADSLTAGELATMIARLNPQLRADTMTVRAARGGRLSELWICLDTAMRPARCSADKQGLRPTARLKIRGVN